MMYNGPPVEFADSFKPSVTPDEDEYTVPTKYAEHPRKKNFGQVTERFDSELSIRHPVTDIETLHQTTHLTAQLHRYNRERWTDWPFPNDGGTLYDVAILDLMKSALNIEDLSASKFSIPAPRLKFLFLMKARHPKNLKSFYAYVNSRAPVRAELGFRDGELPSYETLRKEANVRLPNELAALKDGQDAFNNAILRAVFSVYRNGIMAPDSVMEMVGFTDVAPPLYERNLPRSSKQVALRNWIELLLEETVEPLTFGREKPRTTFKQYIGLFAASALYDCGVQEVANIADYNYPRATIPKGSGVGKYIRDELSLNASQAALQETDIPSITAQFDAVHRATLGIATRYGFFETPRSLGIDLYRIEWNGSENEVTINRPPKSENDVRSQWTYAVLGIIDTEARFTLGTRWLPEKSAYPRVVDELRSIPNDIVEVEALYADSELISGDLITAFRAIAGPDWAVRAPDHERIKQLKRLTPKNYVGYLPNISWNTNPQPAAIAYPMEGKNPSSITFTARDLRRTDLTEIEPQKEFSEYEARDDPRESRLSAVHDLFGNLESVPGVGNASTHVAYLTDRDLSERSASGIHFQYYQRWAVEETINQLSNDTMPVINSGDEALRLYGVNLAILFQNWHTLINRAVSPKYGIRSDVTHSELLTAIQDVAFTDPA